MAAFHDLVGVLRDPGEEGLPPTIYDDLTREYDAMESGGVAQVAELTDAIAARDAEIMALKAKNYELLMSVAAGTSDDSVAVDDSVDDEPDESGSAIDGLFDGKDED